MTGTYNYARARTADGGRRWVIVRPDGAILVGANPATEREARERCAALNAARGKS